MLYARRCRQRQSKDLSRRSHLVENWMNQLNKVAADLYTHSTAHLILDPMTNTSWSTFHHIKLCCCWCCCCRCRCWWWWRNCGFPLIFISFFWSRAKPMGPDIACCRWWMDGSRAGHCSDTVAACRHAFYILVLLLLLIIKFKWPFSPLLHAARSSSASTDGCNRNQNRFIVFLFLLFIPNA